MEIDDTMVREFLVARGRTAGEIEMRVGTPDARFATPRDALLVRLISTYENGDEVEIWRGVMPLAEFNRLVAESV